jgi:Holliday junction resolvase
VEGKELEKHVQREILNYLQANGYMAWKNHLGGIRMGGGRTTVKNPARGAPDVFAVKGGRFYGIEVKKPGGKVAAHQMEWLQRLRSHGGFAVIAESLEDCIRGIEDTVGWDL